MITILNKKNLSVNYLKEINDELKIKVTKNSSHEDIEISLVSMLSNPLSTYGSLSPSYKKLFDKVFDKKNIVSIDEKNNEIDKIKEKHFYESTAFLGYQYNASLEVLIPSFPNFDGSVFEHSLWRVLRCNQVPSSMISIVEHYKAELILDRSLEDPHIENSKKIISDALFANGESEVWFTKNDVDVLTEKFGDKRAIWVDSLDLADKIIATSNYDESICQLQLFVKSLERSEPSEETHYQGLDLWLNPVYERIRQMMATYAQIDGVKANSEPHAEMWGCIYGMVARIIYSPSLITDVVNHHSSAKSRSDALIQEIMKSITIANRKLSEKNKGESHVG